MDQTPEGSSWAVLGVSPCLDASEFPIKTTLASAQEFSSSPRFSIPFLLLLTSYPGKRWRCPAFQVDQIRLIYSGKQLADDHTLAHYNVAAGGTIHMVLQLRGGSR